MHIASTSFPHTITEIKKSLEGARSEPLFYLLDMHLRNYFLGYLKRNWFFYVNIQRQTKINHVTG